MNLTIKTTHYEITPDIRDYLEKKLATLDKLIDMKGDELLVHVELGKTTLHHKSGDVFKAEGRLTIHGHTHIANVEKEDLKAAIDEMRDELVREIKEGKEKSLHNARHGGATVKEIMKSSEDEDSKDE